MEFTARLPAFQLLVLDRYYLLAVLDLESRANGGPVMTPLNLAFYSVLMSNMVLNLKQKSPFIILLLRLLILEQQMNG